MREELPRQQTSAEQPDAKIASAPSVPETKFSEALNELVAEAARNVHTPGLKRLLTAWDSDRTSTLRDRLHLAAGQKIDNHGYNLQQVAGFVVDIVHGRLPRETEPFPETGDEAEQRAAMNRENARVFIEWFENLQNSAVSLEQKKAAE